MAATRPQSNFEQDCIVAAQAALVIASVQQRRPSNTTPARALAQLLAAAGRNWPGSLTRQDRRILWALPRALRNVEGYAGGDAAGAARHWGQQVESAASGRLAAPEMEQTKLVCLRMSDALGHDSKQLRF